MDYNTLPMKKCDFLNRSVLKLLVFWLKNKAAFFLMPEVHENAPKFKEFLTITLIASRTKKRSSDFPLANRHEVHKKDVMLEASRENFGTVEQKEPIHRKS